MLRIKIEMETIKPPRMDIFREGLFSGTVLVSTQLLEELRKTCPRRTVANSMRLEVFRQGKTIFSNIRALPVMRTEQKYRWILPVLERELLLIAGKFTRVIMSRYVDKIKKEKV